jgi:hypothetical protein
MPRPKPAKLRDGLSLMPRTLVTRNVADVEGAEIEVLDLFSDPSLI